MGQVLSKPSKAPQFISHLQSLLYIPYRTNKVTSCRTPKVSITLNDTLTSGGVHIAVAARNDNTNATNTSPTRTTSAITVGASTIADAHASFSNCSSVVDIFAPGQYITSVWIGSTTATNNISGTSMATPHIAGLIAYLISKDSNVTPAAMSTKIQSLTVKNALTSIRTPCLLFYRGHCTPPRNQVEST
ncbi:peptidase S8/S53 domain-containing protein [Cyathus striatus]|nr:peptidase S8/S53 domain-containing protein [Cyathus striatus]